MPKNLTDGATYATAVPVPNGNEQRTIASLEPGFQALADRTAVLKATLDNGVIKVRTVASFASLKALARVTGDMAYVVGYGLYRYNSASSSVAPEPLVVVPNDAVGRWHSGIESMAGAPSGFAALDTNGDVPVAQLPGGVANGVATLDGSGRVVEAQLPNRVVGVYHASSSVTAQTITTAGVTLTGISLVLGALLAGDILLVDGQAAVRVTGSGAARLQVNLGATAIGGALAAPNGVAESVPLCGLRHVVSAAGTPTLTISVEAVPGGGAVEQQPAGWPVTFLRVTHLRP